MKKVFMVAEKPSLAQSLANILSDGKAKTRKGSNGACSVHQWNGYFNNDDVIFIMTSVCGHVMGLDFIGKYNNWDSVDPVELFSAPTEKKEATPKLRMPGFLAQEAKGSDYLVLWLDCDKEGENICFEVIHAVQSSMKYQDNPEYIYRARFSAITEKEIKGAMAHLVRPNENEARSVDARQELDLRIGCAFTRYQTKFFQGKYGDLDASLISYGPCQTPTLGFCVKRHDEIQTFKPEPYWLIEAKLALTDGRKITLDWDRVRCFEKDVASMFLNSIKGTEMAQVLNVENKEKTKARPLALNTVELMRVGSSLLGMSPQTVMQIAEKLYTQGYISYPRTETTHYPASFDLNGTLKILQNSNEIGAEVKAILRDGLSTPRKGHDAGDHPPITPMKLAGELEKDAWRVYDYICRHFASTVARDCKYVLNVVKFMIGSESFTLTGKTLVSPGYTSILHWQSLPKNEVMPTFQIDEEIPVQEMKLIERQTGPPDYLTEAELITLMEKHGIGTDASIPVHINNICQRNYVKVGSGRKLIPTALGIVLVHGYQKIDIDLVLPTMRSAVEKQLNLIAQGLADFHSVLSHTVEIFKQKFLYFVTNIEGMDQLFEVTFSSLADSGKPQSRCGKCRRYLKYIQTKPSRLHCSHCDETYSVPQNGNIRIYKELRCPLDDFELLWWSNGSKSFPFCPYCYNSPPFQDMKKGSGCDLCTHPTCAQSLIANGLSVCLECEGILVLDPGSGPKWKICCNKCDIIVHLFDDAQKVSVEDRKCECGAQILKVEYKEEKSKLPDGLTEMSGCVFCSIEFAPLVRSHRASMRAKSGRSYRGRGSAKHKQRKPKDKMAQLAAYFV